MFLGTGEVIGDMPGPAHLPGRPSPWGLGASLGFHILIGLAILFAVAPRHQTPAVQESINVDVLTEQQFDAANKAEAPAKPLTDLSSEPSMESLVPDLSKKPAIQPRPADNGMIKATHLLSRKVLADPRSAKARKALQELALSERIVQLCNIEAMEQVHLWTSEFQPDFLVAYAMADSKLSGHKLQADGGAFRSKRRWYTIGFTCDVTADLKEVVSFAFRVGEAIPESQWEDHNLSVDDGPAD
ncbi:DUF930 domain-containing protein [Pararhizobium sp. LjRoot235]|uniref:DUF930 domain-containing protein n=1 Tax=Pararhizobium sp. LjRoot235 TaxID=3342291 RepID=UPI003ECF3F10